MTTMIERVALAIGAAEMGGPVEPEKWRAWEETARAAIAAMREPTEGMEWAGIRESALLPIDGRTRRTFTAMIDAALEEKP